MENNQISNDSETAKLKNYIDQQMQAGLNSDEIATQLRQAGWAETKITGAFQLVQAGIMPTNPTTNASGSKDQTAGQPLTQANGKSRGRIKTGWLLLKQSLKIIRTNKGLTRYIAMSALVNLFVVIFYASIFYMGRNTFLEIYYTAEGEDFTLTNVGYLVLFVYYLTAYFFINMYAAGLAANVLDLFKGSSKSYKDYMHLAWSKVRVIFAFSLIEATIGLVLRIIAERSELLGRLVAWLVGALWSIARLFVIPIIISSDENAVSAIKKSIKLLKATWGENIVGRVTFGSVLALIYLFVLIPISTALIAIGAMIAGGWGFAIGAALALMMFIFMGVVSTAASNVLNTALFYFAEHRQIPAAFEADLLNSVFVQKVARTGFLRRKVKTPQA